MARYRPIHAVPQDALVRVGPEHVGLMGQRAVPHAGKRGAVAVERCGDRFVMLRGTAPALAAAFNAAATPIGMATTTTSWKRCPIRLAVVGGFCLHGCRRPLGIGSCPDSRQQEDPRRHSVWPPAVAGWDRDDGKRSRDTQWWIRLDR